MRISLNWLAEYVDLGGETPEALASRLTLAGFEVEGITRIGHGLDGVVLAEVRKTEPHPKSGKLTLVWIFDGAAETRVVCGAQNVPAPGGRVAWARPGVTLPDGRTLEARAVQGELSPGMLCSEIELGLSEEGEGIITLPAGQGTLGAPVVDVLLGRDVVFDVNVTPNRPDCMGHLGIAREVSALYGRPVRRPRIELGSSSSTPIGDRVRVEIADPELSARYTARLVEGIRVGRSPMWLERRLRAVGVRPISNVVDVSNYVMMEYGQPLHAFDDLARVAGPRIVVRKALPNERMTTLDQQERALDAEDIVIADAERAVALGGVMGGADSEVHDGTTAILLESAHFAPGRIRRTSKRLALRSEASQRFERGVDPGAVDEASARACALIVEVAGGAVTSGVVDRFPGQVPPRRVTVRSSAVERLLGITLEPAVIGGYLEPLGLRVRVEGQTVEAEVPSFRADLTREADLVEEVARLHGFDKIPARLHASAGSPDVASRPLRADEVARDALCAAGLDEVITYGFTTPVRLAWFGDERSRRVENPLREEQSVMRTRLCPNLLGVLRTNVDRGLSDVQIFEVGSVFPYGEGHSTNEPIHAAGILTGNRPAWLAAPEAIDFFDARAAVERLLATFGAPAELVATRAQGWLHPGVAASILIGGEVAGAVGEVHPTLRQRYGLVAPVFAFELDLGRMPGGAHRQMVALPRYPQAVRDVSLLLDAGTSAAAIEKEILGAGEPLLVAVRVLEDYRDPAHVPAGKKAMLWSMTYRASDRTLVDAEVDAGHERIVARLCQVLGASRR